MDPTLGQRPQPPDINNGRPVSNGGGVSMLPPTNGGVQRYDHNRVRQWIETRSVSDVRKIRPILNQGHKST